MAALAAVTGLAMFLLIIMGVTGVEFFKGVLHYRCADEHIFDLPEAELYPHGHSVWTNMIDANTGHLPPGEAGAAQRRRHLEFLTAMATGVASSASQSAMGGRAFGRGRSLKGGGGSSDRELTGQAVYDSGVFCYDGVHQCGL